MNLTLIFMAVALIAGSPVAVAGLPLALVLEGFLDERVGDSRRNFSRAGAVFLDSMLYLTLPLTALLALCHASLLASGDPLGLGWAVKSVSAHAGRVIGEDVTVMPRNGIARKRKHVLKM